MNEAAVQLDATEQNHTLDLPALQSQIGHLGIDYLRQHGDIYDLDAFQRCWSGRLEELEILRQLPPGVAIRRSPNTDEVRAYRIDSNATYVAYIDNDGVLTSCFEIPED